MEEGPEDEGEGRIKAVRPSAGPAWRSRGGTHGRPEQGDWGSDGCNMELTMHVRSSNILWPIQTIKGGTSFVAET